MSLIIREAQPEDCAAMSRVLIASITSLCAADHHNDPEAIAAWTRNKSPQGIAEMLGNAALTTLVAIHDGTISGVGAYTEQGGIALNYVAPEARGKGISTALLAAMEQALAALGHSEAHLESTATALEFYRKNLWRENGPQAQGRRVNGFPLVKRLAPTKA